MSTIIYTETDHSITIPDLTDQDDAAVTGATVTATLYESNGSTEVSGVTWPITFTDDGSGAYSVNLPDSVSVEHGKRYQLRVVAESGSAKRTWWEPIIARDGSFG